MIREVFPIICQLLPLIREVFRTIRDIFRMIRKVVQIIRKVVRTIREPCQTIHHIQKISCIPNKLKRVLKRRSSLISRSAQQLAKAGS